MISNMCKLSSLSCFGMSILLLSASLAFGTTVYVSPDGNNIPPFASWENAATNIQYAVNLALDGDEVLVGPGFYLGEANENSGSMITITNAIILRGVSGAAATTVDAAGWHKRCLYVGNTGAFIYGFTFSLGFARTNQGAQTFPISVGGGVFFDGGGTVENCILKFNRAGLAGGNAYFNGGGRMINCLVFEGGAALCGGLYCDGGGEIINCTIVDNWSSSTNLPGGVWCINGGTVINSILDRNPSAVGDAEGVYTEGSGWSFDFSRLSTIFPGNGNITNDPLFVSFDGDNYRLQAGSPCTDIGTNMAWMADSVDLDGTPRIQRGRVDMGAYEQPGVYYVATNGMHVSPFVSWNTAATNIEAVLNVAFPETMILVSNGTFTAADIRIETNITIRAFNGSEQTILRGNGSQRCVSLQHDGARLEGFTISGGYTSNEFGGGVRLKSGTLYDCIITANRSDQFGGGVQAEGGLLDRCRITANSAGWAGAGVACIGGGIIRNSVIDNNSCDAIPLPPSFGSLHLGGGGVIFISGGKLENSTIARNISQNNGGGLLYLPHPSIGLITSYVHNTIISENIALTNGPNYFDPDGALVFEYSCSQPAITAPQDGGGNISDDPEFISPGFGNFRLSNISPCLDAGENKAWMTDAGDYDNNPRIYNATADMGAVEQEIFYAAHAGLHIAPYTNWTDAATNLASALSAAVPGGLVLAAPGTYRPGGTLVITAPPAVTLKSLNGSASTVIHGTGSNQAVYIRNRYSVLDGFTVTGGSVPNVGGGVQIEGGVLQNSIVTGNYAGIVGGGLFMNFESAADKCLFIGNSAGSGGGGGACLGQSEFRNCSFVNNTTPAIPLGPGMALGGGGVIMVSGGRLVSCTVAGNFSSNDGGGIYYTAFQGPVTALVQNTIIFDNTAVSNAMNVFDATGLMCVEFSCSEPDLPSCDGGGNIITNPLFGAGYRLTWPSACRDAGENMPWMVYDRDLDGNPRLIGDRVDMGAYEFIPEPGTVLFLLIPTAIYLRKQRFFL